ncbi:hypothetical protein HZC21_05525 [Candidatus Peregrinibacteria bacterium]|nr:hypothetical protein [Candidatus Peregrinibacteria bacterium]
MKNALRLGGAVAAAALVGLAGDTAKSEDLGDDLPEVPTPVEAVGKVALKALERLEVTQKELDATRLQVEEVLMQLETMEQACEDAATEDGCPVGCVPEGAKTRDRPLYDL